MSSIKQVVLKVVNFYQEKNIEVNHRFLSTIQDAYENKKERFKKLLGDKDTVEIPMSPRSKIHYLFHENSLCRKAAEQLKSAGYDTVDNKVKKNSDKQYKKVTKVLKKFEPDFWSDKRLGDLYTKWNSIKFVASIDPYEFQTASENCGWSSCFRVGGAYHTSVWTYYLYTNSLIVKALDSKGTATGRFFLMFPEDMNDGVVIRSTYGSMRASEIWGISEKICKDLGLPWGEWNPTGFGYNSDS